MTDSMSDTDTAREMNNEKSELMAEIMNKAEANWRDVAMAVKYSPRVLLWGPPGTGKSYTHIQAAKEKGVELFKLTVDQETPGLLLVGMFLPNESGGCSFHYGPASAAMKAGAVLGLDEIDKMSGDALVQCYSVLDDPESAKLTLSNNETIRPAEGFQCIATTNEIPTILPEAIRDRFEIQIKIEHPNPVIFRNKHWNSETLKEAAKRTIYLNESPINGVDGRRIGLRAFLAIDRLIGKGLDMNDAGRLVLGETGGRWLATALTMATAQH